MPLPPPHPHSPRPAQHSPHPAGTRADGSPGNVGGCSHSRSRWASAPVGTVETGTRGCVGGGGAHSGSNLCRGSGEGGLSDPCRWPGHAQRKREPTRGQAGSPGAEGPSEAGLCPARGCRPFVKVTLSGPLAAPHPGPRAPQPPRRVLAQPRPCSWGEALLERKAPEGPPEAGLSLCDSPLARRWPPPPYRGLRELRHWSPLPSVFQHHPCSCLPPTGLPGVGVSLSPEVCHDQGPWPRPGRGLALTDSCWVNTAPRVPSRRWGLCAPPLPLSPVTPRIVKRRLNKCSQGSVGQGACGTSDRSCPSLSPSVTAAAGLQGHRGRAPGGLLSSHP